jgi:hypothetical protein
LTLFELFVQEIETLGVFCVWQHLLLILELSDEEREICDVWVMQQYYSLQMGFCLQEKETLVSLYVHQHQFLKF